MGDDRVDALEGQVAALQAELATLRKEVSQQQARSRAVSRRQLLGLAAGGVLGATLGQASPAAADDPDDVELGALNESSDETRIKSTGTNAAFVAEATADSLAGLIGTSSDSGEGVRAVNTSTGSALTAHRGESADGALGGVATVHILDDTGEPALFVQSDTPSTPSVWFINNGDGLNVLAQSVGAGIPLNALGERIGAVIHAQSQLSLGQPATNGLEPGELPTGVHTAGEVLYDGEDLFLCTVSGTPGTWQAIGGVNVTPNNTNDVQLGALNESATETRIKATGDNAAFVGEAAGDGEAITGTTADGTGLRSSVTGAGVALAAIRGPNALVTDPAPVAVYIQDDTNESTLWVISDTSSTASLFANDGSGETMVIVAEGDGQPLFVTGGAHGIHVEAQAQLRCEVPDDDPGPGTFPAPVSRGMIRYDDEDLYLCVVGGTPGTWRRLGGLNAQGALAMNPTPIRAYDSRSGRAPLVGKKGKLASGEIRVVDLNTGGAVPANATAALVNVTVTGTGAEGFVALFSAAASNTSSSTVNWWEANSQLANTTVTAISADGKVKLKGAVTPTHVILDVIGYYR